MRLVLMAALSGMVAGVACNGGGGGGSEARDLVPDLADQGLEIDAEGRDPLVSEEQDMYRVLYVDPDDPARQALTVTYVDDTEELAQVNYNTLSKALENPPPGYFGGGDAVQQESPALEIGEERKAFVTSQPDRNGLVILTDIYRSGRTVLITQVLGRYDADHAPLRTLLAERVFAEAP